jgi:hypothetical protein
VGAAPFRGLDLAAVTGLEGLDEPVGRYLRHAIAPGAAPSDRVRLTMRGRIRVGPWLDFEAEQEFAGHDFTWRARAGRWRWRPLHVVDHFRDGAGGTDGRLFGRLRFLHADDADTARAAAGRAAAESIWVPGTLLPGRGVQWRAEADDRIVATLDVPPERIELELGIDSAGAPRTVRLLRWGNVGRDGFGPIPFGGRLGEDRRFGDVVVPTRVVVGWWYGTPRYRPFFDASVTGYA